jgi:hypothetical protein
MITIGHNWQHLGLRDRLNSRLPHLHEFLWVNDRASQARFTNRVRGTDISLISRVHRPQGKRTFTEHLPLSRTRKPPADRVHALAGQCGWPGCATPENVSCDQAKRRLMDAAAVGGLA